MVSMMKKLILAFALLGLNASSAPASDLIRKACQKSGRPAATREMCSCIQRVANIRLKRRDQRLAASFFKTPHKAQVIRQSDRPSNEAFWLRYKAWGQAAEKSCGS